MSQNVSRRELIKGAALGAAALGTGTASLAGASEAQTGAGEPAWDAEYDVVVIGLGGAGANAAIAAYDAGASVLVCEKAAEGEAPCNTNASGQNIIATDDADALYSYFCQLMGKFENWDEESVRALADGCAENFDWVVNTLGADPEVVCPREDPTPKVGPTKYHWDLEENPWGLGRPGYVVTWDEFPEIPESAHCKNVLVSGVSFDSSYYNLLMADVAQRAAEGDRLVVWNSCPGLDLITDAEGAVTGAVVERDGEQLRVKANGGVVLACGGYENAPEMLSDYAQMPYVYIIAGTTNTGDGVRMAAEVGARLWHMSNTSGWTAAYRKPGHSTCTNVNTINNGVYVGLNGARFMSESSPTRHGRYNVGGRWIECPVSLPLYYIVDSDQIANKMVKNFSEGNADELADGEIIQADTIEELSQKIRDLGNAPDFNANGELDEALERYNAHCHANDGAGEKDDFGRMCTVPVEKPPFYALELGATMANTQGGPRRNGMAQVLDYKGMPIPGLFSAGELGSVFADMYNGGGNLAETMVFGRYAGANAAARARGEFVGATEPALTHHEKLAAEAARKAEEDAAGQLAALGDGYADGTYEGSGSGYGGRLTLSVTVEGGKVSGVEVVESSESPEIGGKALPSYSEQLVEKQDLSQIDVASGASNTLRGFKEAVADALAQA